MTKRILSFVLIICLVLPVLVLIGGVVFTPENGFEQFDKERESSFESALSYDVFKGSSAQQNRDYENSYIVKFKNDVALNQIQEVLKEYSYTLLAESEQRLFSVIADEGFINSNKEIIEYSEKDLVRNSLAVTNDPEVFADYEKMGIYGAWEVTKGEKSVVVAVLDTGIDRRHEDLPNGNILAGYDAVSGISGVTDDTAGHGTGVIGLIAATADNGIGIAGVAPNITVLPIKVSVSGTTIYSSDLIRGIRFAADAGAKVINMSIGGYASSYAEQSAIDYALSKGCIIIAAAGNGGKGIYADQKSYPASYEGVISVASVDTKGKRSDFSQYNEYVDVAAYGEDIVMPYVDAYGNSVYKVQSGTSFACAFVSGIAALSASVNQEVRFESDEFLALITSVCGNQRNDEIGYGIINGEKIMKIAAQPIITGAYNGGLYSESVKIGFNRGTATLNGDSFKDGKTVIANGKHTLVVTYGEFTKTISFRLDYDPISYEFLEFPTYAYFEFKRGTAFLDGYPYESGQKITKSGEHTFVLTDGDETLRKTVSLKYTLPTVYGVTDGSVYDRPVVISVIGDGVAQLNGEMVYGRTVVYKNGKYDLKISSGNGNIVKTLSFEVKYENGVFIENDYANGISVIDEENRFFCLYGESLVGVRVYDMDSPEEYLHFLPIGTVYGHAFSNGKLLFFGDMGITVIDPLLAKNGMESVVQHIDFDGMNYYAYLQETVFGFGNGKMFYFDEFGVPAIIAELGFDCQKAFFFDNKFYLLAPDLDNIIRVFEPETQTVTEIDLGVTLKDEKIVFGEGYLAVGNRVFDLNSQKLVLEFESNFAVMIKEGRVFASNEIIDIESSEIVGIFPFQISHISQTETHNYLLGTETNMAIINNPQDFGASTPVEEIFAQTDKMNDYHVNGFYDKYSALVSSASWENKIFLLLGGKPIIYCYNAETLSEEPCVKLKYIPKAINCSNGYVAVCFRNSPSVYVAHYETLNEGRYIQLPDVCDDTTSANRNIYFVSNQKLYVYTPEQEVLSETEISAQQVESSSEFLFVYFDGILSVYDFSLNLLGTIAANGGKIVLSDEYIAIGNDVFKSNGFERISTVNGTILAMKGNYAVTSQGIYRIDKNQYVGETAIKYSAAAVITSNNTVVTFGGGHVCFCSYGSGVDVILNPKVEGIEQNGVYEGKATVSYSDGIGYLDGKPFESGTEVNSVGNHRFILVLPCARNLIIDFYISPPLSKIEFASGDKTISVGESINLTIKYIPDGSSPIKPRFEYDKNGLSITDDGYVTALAVGKYSVKAVVETGSSVLEANCVITVLDNLAVFPEESGLKIDRNHNFLLGIQSGTTSQYLLSLLETNRKAEILDSKGNLVEGYISTSDRLVLYGENGEKDDSLELVVVGDIDGDGYLSAVDLYHLKQILGDTDYPEIFAHAGDMNGNIRVSDTDYRILEEILLNQRNFVPAKPKDINFGGFSAQAMTTVVSGNEIDIAVVLTGCKFAKGISGGLNFKGMELISLSTDDWESDYAYTQNRLDFYAFSKNNQPCNTAFRVVLNLKFRVTAKAGESISLSSDGLTVSLNNDCRNVRFTPFEKEVAEKTNKEFEINILNAHGFIFDSNVYEYEITVPYNSAIVDFSVSCTEDQKYSISSCVIPNNGKTEILIRLSDSTGSNLYYTFKVTKETTPGIESDCKLSDLEIEGHSFKPVFDEDFFEYFLTVPYDVEKLNIYAVAKSKQDQIQISGTNLTEGENLITVTVFAPDGEWLEYSITVTRLPKPEPPIESIEESSVEESQPESSVEIPVVEETKLTWLWIVLGIVVLAGATVLVIRLDIFRQKG